MGPLLRLQGWYAAVIEALSGFMSAHGDDKMPPVVTPAHQTYQVASVHAAYLTLGGIRHARLTGVGPAHRSLNRGSNNLHGLQRHFPLHTAQ